MTRRTSHSTRPRSSLWDAGLDLVNNTGTTDSARRVNSALKKANDKEKIK